MMEPPPQQDARRSRSARLGSEIKILVKENIMRLSSNFALLLAALLFGFLLIPQAALAGSENCPVEPATDVLIATGDTFVGPNCTLNTVGDVDSFVFSGKKGDIWQLALGLNGPATENICLTLYPPTGAAIYSGCTGIPYYFSAWTDQTLTTTGTYTMVITEAASGTQNYAVSLERLYPVPPNAQRVSLGKVYAGDIAWLTDLNAFTFAGVAKDEFEVSAALPSGATQNLCMYVFAPTGTSAGSACTGIPYYYTAQVNVTPPKSGTYLVFLVAAGYDAIVPNYNLEVSCLVGVNNCLGPLPPAPACTLKDEATYDPIAKTLTMNFTVGNKAAATWNAWLTSQNNNTTALFSVAQPITNPPVVVIQNTTLSPEGTVGVLSTLTTPKNGVICSSWQVIATGTP
jgi:hypothetical protein